jgi:hypothetical protein
MAGNSGFFEQNNKIFFAAKKVLTPGTLSDKLRPRSSVNLGKNLEVLQIPNEHLVVNNFQNS